MNNYTLAVRQLGNVLNSSTKSALRLCPNVTFLASRTNSFQSSISLKSLYPSSSLKLTTPTEVPQKPGVKFNGYIPIESLKITYSRSSGPGGQHVNTVNTKVDVRFHLETAGWLHPDLRAKIAELHKTKINKEGQLIVRSDKTRSQQLNLADCMDALRFLIRQAEFQPPPPSEESLEQARRRKEKANQMRLIEKRTRSSIKANRQAPLI